MQLKAFAFISLFLLSSALASPLAAGTVCEGQVTLSETYIGKDKNVKVEYVSCPDTAPVEPRALPDLQARQANVCGANCATNCFPHAGGGPDPNECHVIADALKYESQNTGPIFPIGTGSNNTLVMTYSSCLTFFANQASGALAYCRNDWADVMDYVAFNCQAPQDAHGGNCVAADKRWFIQVQHS